MNAFNKIRHHVDGLDPTGGIEPAVSATKAEHFRNSVAQVQFAEQRADHIVQTRAQAAAGHDSGARFLRVEKETRPRPGQLEMHSGVSPDLNSFWNTNV